MRSKVERQSEEAEKAVRDIRRATRRQYSAEEKVRIVIAGLRGDVFPIFTSSERVRNLA
jgi:transposase